MACIPGFVPVLSQVLTVLESTIYRQAGQHTPESFASSSVDDVNGPDAVAPIPMTIANAARSMAENRLIMLLRDVTGNDAPDRHHFRDLYLRAFNGVLKAACRRVSLHNNGKLFSGSRRIPFCTPAATSIARLEALFREDAILIWKPSVDAIAIC